MQLQLFIPLSMYPVPTPKPLESILTWLRPNGLLVVTMGAVSEEAKFKQDWLGAPMYWSHFDAPTNRALCKR